ncbi:SpoIIE family protein phosphatase [Aminipila butyrica]|uniref:SpoIIE family protein phosphatase n=1 Tax=Aminipila butyrica TaxID=433296 RepID=A0A858BW76_9FIRM|nr:SpoIIE family protein phosphatase [Aminipila butyrica]QIB69325.1 SpoIIE family protein phosphatase [Aminipila butyrica]
MIVDILDWARIARDASELVLVSCFCISILEITLGGKADKKRRFLKWCIVIGVMQFALFFSTMGMNALDLHIATTMPEFWMTTSASRLMMTAVYVLFNSITMLLPTILSFWGGVWIYPQQKSAKIFTAVLAGLVAAIISSYISQLILLPFYRDNGESNMKDYPELWVSCLIFSLCMLCAFMVYRRVCCHRLKRMIESADGRIDSFIRIPVCSSILFALLISTLSTFGIGPASINWMDTTIYVVVFACLISAYMLMYWSIFRGMTLSAQAAKSKAELDVAKNIQVSVLPRTFPAFPERTEFNVYALMEPAKEVGGDFYDFFFVDENHLAIVIADVSGKGVPAALFMMTARTLLKNLALTGKQPEDVLFEANNHLCENNEAEMFVTAWIGILQIDSGRLCFANAGHNPPLLKTAGQACTYLDYKTYKRSIMLGMRENIVYYQNEIFMKRGEILFLYTDGVTEACNKDSKLFGEERLKSYIQTTDSNSLENILHRLQEELELFMVGTEQSDDITMLALRMDVLPDMLEVKASANQIAEVSDFIEQILEKNACPTGVLRRVLVAVDEIFSNIVQYSGADSAVIRCLVNEEEVCISFEDNGKAYNPLDAEEPDITAPAEERKIGGLGILIVKKSMDTVEYSYSEGKNRLTVKKKR